MGNSSKVSELTDNLTKVIREQFRLEFLQLKKELFNSDYTRKKGKQKEYISRKETAELLDVSYVTTYDWTKKGILVPYRIGSKTFFKYNDIVQILEGTYDSPLP